MSAAGPASAGPLSTGRSVASGDKKAGPTLDEWHARVAEKKRTDAEAAAQRAADQAALEAAAKAVSNAQFEQWKRRKGTIEIALEVRVRGCEHLCVVCLCACGGLSAVPVRAPPVLVLAVEGGGGYGGWVGSQLTPPHPPPPHRPSDFLVPTRAQWHILPSPLACNVRPTGSPHGAAREGPDGGLV